MPTTQRIPPETTEKRRLVSDATMPASRFPSAGVLDTCANSIPPRRPRISSGVTVSTIVERNTALTWSAAPAAASSSSATQSVVVKPNAAIATPQPQAAITIARPCRCTRITHPETSDAANAPTAGAANR